MGYQHKRMQVMVERESTRQLTGRVEIDDAYLGGSPNEIPFIMAVSTTDDHRPHQVAMQCTPFRSAAIGDWTGSALSANTHVLSDGLPAFRTLHKTVASHQAIVSRPGRSAAQHPEFQGVNIWLGNLKTAINGTYHAFKFGKYASRYLADFQYRFNRRYNLCSILPRLLRAAVLTSPWPELWA